MLHDSCYIYETAILHLFTMSIVVYDQHMQYVCIYHVSSLRDEPIWTKLCRNIITSIWTSTCLKKQNKTKVTPQLLGLKCTCSFHHPHVKMSFPTSQSPQFGCMMECWAFLLFTAIFFNGHRSGYINFLVLSFFYI